MAREVVIVDWHRLLASFKDAVGGLPNYKRSMIWEYVKAKDQLIEELQSDLREIQIYNAGERRKEKELAAVTATDEEYIEHKNKAFPAQLDITAPEKGVTVEYDYVRKVLYVHVDGYTALRICRIPGPVEFCGDSKIALPLVTTDG